MEYKKYIINELQEKDISCKEHNVKSNLKRKIT